jgi:type II secretory pathway component PulF
MEPTTTITENKPRTQNWQAQKQTISTVSQSPPNNRQVNIWQRIQNFKVEFGPSHKDILNFTNQLAVMVRAGISLQDSLESIAVEIDNQKFKVVITDLKTQIEAGQSFSQALANYPQVFSNLYINMVASAEISGSLSEMLQKLAEYLDQEAETRSQVK